jgi:hypothetical protein
LLSGVNEMMQLNKMKKIGNVILAIYMCIAMPVCLLLLFLLIIPAKLIDMIMTIFANGIVRLANGIIRLHNSDYNKPNNPKE